MSQDARRGPSGLGVIGVNHRTAPIEVRERFHGAADELRRSIAGGEVEALAGSVILSTCNRVELYVSAPVPERVLDVAESLLVGRAGLTPAEARGHLYRRQGREAAEHLFRVAAGLDSLVPGEAEIQGQVGEAYREARESGSETMDPVLHRLFQDALSAGGRVRAETGLGEGTASVPSAAVELARKVFGSLEGRRAMVMGAGAMGRLTMECLAGEGVRHTAVASRTLEHARELAGRVGGEPVALEAVPERLSGVDILVSCTSSDTAILGEETLRERGREGARPLVILDIAVPRDVEPGVDRLPEVFLYNIDDLQRVVEGAEQSRLAEVPRAEAIVRECVEEFRSWQRAREAVPMIRELRGRAREVRDRTVEELLDELADSREGDGPGDEERERIRRAFRSLVNRLLHEPTVALREAAARPDGERHLAAMRRLFGLEKGPGADDGGDDGADGKTGDRTDDGRAGAQETLTTDEPEGSLDG